MLSNIVSALDHSFHKILIKKNKASYLGHECLLKVDKATERDISLKGVDKGFLFLNCFFLRKH